MKKTLITLFALSLTLTSFAQKFSPAIKEGTVLYCSAFVQGQEFPLVLSVKSAGSPFVMGWNVDGYGDGTFEMSSNSIAKGDKIYAPTQPNLGVTKLADDETFGMISKSAYQSLIADKEVTLSGVNFKVKAVPTAIKIGDKEVDVMHVVGADGKLEIWILNNEKFPLIIQTLGMPTDMVVVEIK